MKKDFSLSMLGDFVSLVISNKESILDHFMTASALAGKGVVKKEESFYTLMKNNSIKLDDPDSIILYNALWDMLDSLPDKYSILYSFVEGILDEIGALS